jgi:hypothetical protein
MLKFDMFVNETNTKFGDYEFAISELEKNLPVPSEEIVDESENKVDSTTDTTSDSSNIMSIDLKNIIKQELANEQN